MLPWGNNGGFFVLDDGYTETRDRCRNEWVKTSRFFDRNFCMKYFPEEMTFVQGKNFFNFFLFFRNFEIF